jgi:hypothetical protein
LNIFCFFFINELKDGITGKLLSLAGEDDTIVFLLEPLHGVLLGQSVLETNLATLAATVGDIESRTSEHDVEVKTIDTNAGIVLDSQVNVFLDTESKVSCA